MPEFNLDPLSNLNDPYGRAREGQSRLAENYGQIAEHGVFGDEGISRIGRGKGREIALRRQALRKRLKNSIFRRLGPRAGGSADLIAANQIEAPAFAQMQEFMQKLRRDNEISKLTGLAGRERAIGALNNLYLQNRRLNLQEDEGNVGFLDYLQQAQSLVPTLDDYFSKEDVQKGAAAAGGVPV